MRRFRFPLAKVRRWRAHRERAARRELAAALAEVAQMERMLAMVSENLAACEGEEGGPARSLAVAMLNGLRRTETDLRRRLVQAEQLVASARAVYAERRRDLRVLERLEEKRREEWRREVSAAEQAEIEEMGQLLAASRRVEEER